MKLMDHNGRLFGKISVIDVLVVLVVPNVLNLAVYGWGRDAAYLRSYAGKLAAKLKRKGKAE